jgi:hypothetical protein
MCALVIVEPAAGSVTSHLYRFASTRAQTRARQAERPSPQGRPMQARVTTGLCADLVPDAQPFTGKRLRRQVLDHPEHGPLRRAVRVGRVRLAPLLPVHRVGVSVRGNLDVQRVVDLPVDRRSRKSVNTSPGSVGFGGVPVDDQRVRAVFVAGIMSSIAFDVICASSHTTSDTREPPPETPLSGTEQDPRAVAELDRLIRRRPRSLDVRRDLLAAIRHPRHRP